MKAKKQMKKSETEKGKYEKKNKLRQQTNLLKQAK